MRNAIKYYYNIDVDELDYDNREYLFDNYILKEINRDVDMELYNFFISNNIYINKIVSNKDNEIITMIDGKRYMLLQNDSKVDLNLNTINSFDMELNVEKKKSWWQLWEKKVDYYERTFVKNIDKEFLETFPYYIGLSELAIRLCKENKEDSTYSICHDRINSRDFYSPDNIIIDYKVRDIAEYIKLSFFEDKLNLEEVYDFFNNTILKRGDYVLLFARLLFPTYIYDCIENNTDTKKYISKINQYENLLNEIYYYISSRTYIPKIYWLIKTV